MVGRPFWQYAQDIIPDRYRSADWFLLVRTAAHHARCRHLAYVVCCSPSPLKDLHIIIDTIFSCNLGAYKFRIMMPVALYERSRPQPVGKC